jgi:hypothetical protein
MNTLARNYLHIHTPKRQSATVSYRLVSIRDSGIFIAGILLRDTATVGPDV